MLELIQRAAAAVSSSFFFFFEGKLAPYFKGFNSERLSDQAFMAFHLRELMKPPALKIEVVLLTA